MTDKDEKTSIYKFPDIDRAIEKAPRSPLSPSMREALKFPVEDSNYTHVEKRAAQGALDFNGAGYDALTFVESSGWPGFQALALLGQLSEYRKMHERLADECVRKFGRVVSSGESPPERLKSIESELERLDIKSHIHKVVMNDQAFGGAHVYFKMKGDDSVRNTPLVPRSYSVPVGSFEGLRVIEPYWVTPNNYNSIDPSRSDFYVPASWWMLGMDVHASRLYTVVSRPVPDMLKASYSFRGISLTQLAMPYVDNWLRTRQSVSDTVKQFSVTAVKMDLAQALQPGGSNELHKRAELLNAYRDNRNLLALDMATEDLMQINTPLSGLDALQAQAQEQMSAVSNIPLVVLLGITPTGLNASSEGEIRVWYDYVLGYCNRVLSPLMHRILKLVQLSLFGDIDEHVRWDWYPMHELTELEESEAQLRESDRDIRYIDASVLAPEEVRRRLASDPNSGYSGILSDSELDTSSDMDVSLEQELKDITDNIMRQEARAGNDDEPDSKPEPIQ